METEELTAQISELEGELEAALEKWRIAQGTAMERKKKIEQLEKQLEEVDVDFMRVIHAREVEQLREILDACEAANFRHLARIDNLEQLCRDLWEFSNVTGSGGAEKAFKERMEQLGLLDGEQNG